MNTNLLGDQDPPKGEVMQRNPPDNKDQVEDEYFAFTDHMFLHTCQYRGKNVCGFMVSTKDKKMCYIFNSQGIDDGMQRGTQNAYDEMTRNGYRKVAIRRCNVEHEVNVGQSLFNSKWARDRSDMCLGVTHVLESCEMTEFGR